MIQEFFDKHIFLYIMGGLCGLGVILKCFLLIVYNKLISSSENMAHAKRNWLKNMKMRFESSYQLQLGVNDVDTYVDKYVSKIKCGGLLLSTWENISGQTIGLCLLTGSFAGILGFIYECGKGPVLFTFFTGAWTAIIVNIVDNIVNISAHKQMLRFNLIDYFENNLKVRMEQEVFHPEARRKYQREYFDEDQTESSAEANTGSKHILKGAKAMAATTEVLEDQSRETKVQNPSECNKDIKLSWREKRKQKKEDKKQVGREKQQMKYDAKAAKKKEKEDRIQQKLDAKEAKKKEKIDAAETKRQSKLQSKQAVIDQKNMKKVKREEAREAKERAEIEALQQKKKAKQDVKEQREKVEQERKQKELQNNKAYREKMRLKEEKERLTAKKEETRIKDVHEKNGKDIDNMSDASFHEINESQTKQQLRGAIKELSKERIKVVKGDSSHVEELIDFDNEVDKEVSEMTATSKEEDLLIEEVLKDFLS